MLFNFLIPLHFQKKQSKKLLAMGKGDKKTKRGKIVNKSYGVHRPRKKKKTLVEVKAEETNTKAKKETKPKEEKKKTTAKKTAAKKTTTKKTATTKKETAAKEKKTTKKKKTKKEKDE